MTKSKRDKLSKSKRFLSLAYLEEPGIECCLWPHLYWRRDMCETVLRKTRAEQLAKSSRHKKRKTDDDGSSGEDSPAAESDDSDDDDAQNTAHCVKHSFLVKVLSPVVGYSADYELLQFVYDLHMWTTLGAKKNVGQQHGVDFRLMLKKCSFSPEYWRTQHDALIDLQRQCNFPMLFRTRAPYEKSFPYHAWVLTRCARKVEAASTWPAPRLSTWPTCSGSWTRGSSLAGTAGRSWARKAGPSTYSQRPTRVLPPC